MKCERPFFANILNDNPIRKYCETEERNINFTKKKFCKTELVYLTGTMHIVPPLTDLDPVYRPLRPLFIDMVIPTYCNF